MYILGISAYYHDSAACIVKSGKVLVAVEEERFSRIKHDNSFPFQAVKFCLEYLSLTIQDIYCVSYYEKQLLKFERILGMFVKTYPYSIKPFLKSLPEWLDYKIKIEYTVRKKLGFKKKIFFIPHHLSHASAAFYPSPYKKAAILTVDGVGEYQTTALWQGNKTEIELLKEINFPHSLGLFYSTITAFLGFRVNNDEYKVMGLAAYGKPKFVKDLYKIIDIKQDGSFRLNLKYFAFEYSFQMWSKCLEKLLGKPRKSNDPLNQRDKDLANSLQTVTEDIYFRILNHLYQKTKVKNLCVAGGVGLNSLANGKIYQNTPFKKVFIFGPAGDSGASIGSALYTYHSLLKNQQRKKIASLYLGSKYSDSEIEVELRKRKLKYKRFKNNTELVKRTAKLLANNKIIGWFQNRMEFGPRALGARSILANPKDRKMKAWVNRIKKREQFRPFAGSTLQEHIHELFFVPEEKLYSPFMNFCFITKNKRIKDISAIVHKDNTCRIQTVNKKDNGLYYELIKQFYKETGVPCILNTSFNIKGKPIVNSPQQAIKNFLNTKIDFLIINNYLVSKN